MELGLRGLAVLVTGGSRGLGREIARGFASEGANVAICARASDQLAVALDELRGLSVQALAIQADLFESIDCIRVVEETVEEFGRIDVLINNASTNVVYPGRLEVVTDDLLMERVRGKALAAIRCSRAALPHFRRVGGGRIICIGGLAARAVSGPQGSASSLTAGLANAMLVNFAKNLSYEVARDHILVNVVHPGSMRTDRYPARVAARAREMGGSLEEAERDLAMQIPIGRQLDPQDIAPLVVFLASSKAAAITGQSLAIDGGYLDQIVY